MKKIALFLAFVFTLSLCGCGEKEKKAQLKVDIEYYAKLGQMTDCDFTLGESLDELDRLVEDSLDAEHTHDEDAVIYEQSEHDEYTEISAGNFKYFYLTDKKDGGIGCIVSLDGAYGFEQGAVAVDIKEKLAAAGFEAEEKQAQDNEVFFLPSFARFTCLSYDFGKNTVRFIFENNALCACTLSGEDWSL